jgi:hypothetical protein
MKKLSLLAIATATLLVGCASTSGVMQGENGTYFISAKAAPARGGTAGANALAYEEANKFCAGKGLGSAVVINQQERDVYQGGFAASSNQSSGFGSGGFAAGGSANLRFRCSK